MKTSPHTTNTTSPCPLPSRDATCACFPHAMSGETWCLLFWTKKNKRSSRTWLLWWLKYFGNEYCGDLSVMTCCLVVNGIHPVQVQQALYAENNDARLAQLLDRGRGRLVGAVLSSPPDKSFTDVPLEAESYNLPASASWVQEVANVKSWISAAFVSWRSSM